MTAIFDRTAGLVAFVALMLTVLTAVRLACVDGCLRSVTIDGPSMAPALLGRHLLLRCSDCAFPFACDAEHLPADERVACPNCGHVDAATKQENVKPVERVLIDRWPLIWRQPRRWEMVAFQTAEGDLSVKRVGWLPGESMSILGGELIRGEQLLQKSPAEARAVRILVYDHAYRPRQAASDRSRWHAEAQDGAWREEQNRFLASGHPKSEAEFEWLTYEHWPGTRDEARRTATSPVTDNDSYNQGETKRILNEVSDVLLTCRLQGRGRICFRASDLGERLEVVVRPGESLILRRNGREIWARSGDDAFASGVSDVEFGLVDGQVVLTVNGRTVLCESYSREDARGNAELHPLAIGFGEGEIHLDDLRVWRDIYYLDGDGLDRGWKAPGALAANEIGVLGDNQPISLDSRQWERVGVPRDRWLGVVYAWEARRISR